MKVGTVRDNLGLFNPVDEKKDTAEFADKQKEQEQKQSKDEEKEIPVTDESLNSAIESFKTDPQTLANGIQAFPEGQGPGLRVVLKDPKGRVLRQLSGEEFLKLREAAAKNPRKSGKILDQKL